MEDLVFLGISVPIVLVAFSRTTRASSILGWLMLGGAVAMFATMGDTSGDSHGLQGLANGVLLLGAMGLALVGLILLGVSPTSKKPNPSQLAPLPVARRESGFTSLGVLVIAGAFAMLGAIEPTDSDVEGMGKLAASVLPLAAIGVMAFGVVLLAVGQNKNKKRCPEAPALPVATAIPTGDH
jgi:hypothetical protein